jgi:hypothetical protein
MKKNSLEIVLANRHALSGGQRSVSEAEPVQSPAETVFVLLT